MTTISAETRLRDRNQLTLPDAIVRAGQIEVGQAFVVELKSGDPDLVLLRRVRGSYAGALRGLWGEDPDAWLETEREEWNRP